MRKNCPFCPQGCVSKSPDVSTPSSLLMKSFIKDLANGETIRRLWETNLALGIYVPVIVTPEELGEEE